MPFNDDNSLQNHFLIAMPSMEDSTFAQSVVYLCAHSEEGAMGLIINLPSTESVTSVLNELGIEQQLCLDHPVYCGGPVSSDRGFILHDDISTSFESSLAPSETLRLTTSADILDCLATSAAPSRWLFALGFAGWGEYQLEDEIARNDWLIVPADEHVLFRTPPAERLTAATALLGITLDQLSGQAGHA